MGQCLPLKFPRIHRTYVLCLDWKKAWQFIGASVRSSPSPIQTLDGSSGGSKDLHGCGIGRSCCIATQTWNEMDHTPKVVRQGAALYQFKIAKIYERGKPCLFEDVFS